MVWSVLDAECWVWKMSSQKQAQRPRRQRKGDRMITPGATAAEIRCDYALAPFDRLAEDLDRKWGIDRLVELVPVEMAERYGSAMAKLNEAIDSADPEQVKLRAGVCMRGLEAMDRKATESGAEAASDEVWLLQADGVEFGMLRDPRGWQRAKSKHPEIEMVSEREVVLAIQMYRRAHIGQMVEAVRGSFPDAEVVKAKLADDPIPF